MSSENNDNNHSLINDINDIILNDDSNDNVVPSENINDNFIDSIQLDEFHEYDRYLDKVLEKHLIKEAPIISTENNEKSFHEETMLSKFDILTTEFSTFKVQVIKEFLFLKHLIESSNKIEPNEKDINNDLILENQRLKKENEKLKQWIDDIFELSKVNKREEVYESKSPMAIPSNNPQSENILKRKEVSNKIGDESITMSDLPNELQQSKKLPVKNVIESKNEKRNETYDSNLPSSITCRKRPINKNQSDNTKRKRTDEALSISQNIPNYNSCNFAMLQSNSQRYDPPNKKIAPGRRTYAETLEYGKKIVIFGDSHMKRIDRKKLNQNINGKAVMKIFDGVTSE